jgi:nucleotide-binding universal stress UspA family protein
MKRFKSILVVAGGKDGGVAAIARAADLAKRNNASVTIVDVVDPLPPLLEIPGIAEEESHHELVARKQAALERLASRLCNENIVVECHLLKGPPAEQIIQRVIREKHDLVIKTADEPSGIYQRFFGTTGHRLMRKCPCPVWIVKAGSEDRFRRILAAVDPKPNDKSRNALNVKILQLATSLADLDDSELHVIYVRPDWTDWVSPRSNGGDSRELIQYQREIETLQQRMLSDIIDPFRNQDQIDHVHLLKGSPADQISRLADELKIELLVMGTVCRTGVSGFLIGNTAETVLNQVNCSVLTIKPKDFVTPVVVAKH